MAPVYKHSYLPVSVYGHVVSLLKAEARGPGVHIDIGCGYGAIAEPVRDEIGLIYVGFDLAADGLASLDERGFETHTLDLGDVAKTEAAVRAAVGSRRIVSLTFLDTLEHVVNGPAVLAMLRRLAEASGATLVLSVPNATHKDVALKLLTGRWDVTEAGLLDHTHVECYSESRLRRLTAACGWREIAEKDWLLETSDQRFPESFPLFDHTVPIGAFLRQLIEDANARLLVNQFVRAYQVDAPAPIALLDDRSEPSGPLFSLVIATRERSAGKLAPLFDALARQTCQDFELIVVRHSDAAAPEDDYLAVLPPALQPKIAVVDRPGLHRSGALNAAVERVSGRHVIVLPEEAVVSADWLAAFAELGAARPRSALRVGVAQGASAAAQAILPFDLGTLASAAAFALPSGVFHHLGIKFDERTPDGDAFDAIVRAVMLVGVHATPAPHVTLPEARETGDAEARKARLREILARLNNGPILLPAGSAARITFQSSEKFGLRRQFNEAYSLNAADERAPDDQPFLSVITRTTGSRNDTLRETLMSLAGQSSPNFEVLLVVHSEHAATIASIKDLVAEFPPSMTKRVNVVQCARPGRSAPLNDALNYVRGKYASVLDDDDFVFSHWVETFENLAKGRPYSLLRATCARQDYEMTAKGDERMPRATTWFKMDWPSTYDAIDHLYLNRTPFMSVAIPMDVFTSLGLRWDETLSTTEDWHLVTRAAMNCGVASTPEVTSVYRWWTSGESSSFAHSRAEWDKNRARILEALDRQPVLLPPGSVSRICALIEAEKENLEKKRKKAPVKRLLKRLERSVRRRVKRLPTMSKN
jgi:Glycosyltransferase like family 2/Methyltransferase domain